MRALFRRITRRRRTLDGTRFDCRLGPALFLRGALRTAGDCVVCGRAEGDARVGGTFLLAAGGYWQGDIRAARVVIAGEVRGNVSAREKLEIRAGARVHGHLKSPVIAMAEGTLHVGEVRMARRTRMIRFDERRKHKDAGSR